MFFYLHIIFLLYFSISNLFATEKVEICLTEEDTLKYNFNIYRRSNRPLVLHAAFEGPNAIVGGLGMVIRDLSGQMKKKLENCFTIVPYYKFLQETLPRIKKARSLGFFHHNLFNSIKKTEVFLNEQEKQILFLPDISIKDCCDIVSGVDKIYEPNQNFLRIIYFNSAIAKFAHLVHADIVQLHAWQTALSIPLIKKIINPSRTISNLKEIKVISTFHMFNEEQGKDTVQMYNFVGIPTPKSDFINLAATAIIESDYLTTVSQGLMTYFEHPITSYGLRELFKNKEGYIRGITNGINYSNFNPFLLENLGECHLSSEFTIKELKAAKEKAKFLLWEKKLISSLEKPLMLYVGRFSDEKGTEYFPFIVEKWLSMGGQVVLMGILTQDNRAFQILERLKERQKNEELFADNLKIYTDLKKDQLDFIPDTSVPKGKLIRFASDLTCIPSKAEACGLVAMESFCFGTPVFTSWVQGLKDSCFPHGIFHPLLDKIIDHTDFNAFSFQYFPEDFVRTVKDMNKNLRKAYNIVIGKEMEKETFLIAQKRMIDVGKNFDWDAPKGSLEQYIELYSSLIGDSYQMSYVHELYEELDSKKGSLVQKTCQKFGGYPSEKIVFKYDKFYPFVMTTLKQGKREYETQDNKPNLKDLTRVTVKNSHLYFSNGLELFDTDILRSKDFYCTWVLNKKGELFSGAFCHAYFLKSKPGYPYYGYGKPIACGGDIIVKKGKIIYIDNRSGHYEPNKDQFLLALFYFNSLDIFDQNCVIKEEKTGENILLEDIENINVIEIMSKYSFLEDLI